MADSIYNGDNIGEIANKDRAGEVLFRYLLANYPEAIRNEGAMPPDIFQKNSQEEIEVLARQLWDEAWEDEDDDYEPPSLAYMVIYKDGSFELAEFAFPEPEFTDEDDD